MELASFTFLSAVSFSIFLSFALAVSSQLYFLILANSTNVKIKTNSREFFVVEFFFPISQGRGMCASGGCFRPHLPLFPYSVSCSAFHLWVDDKRDKDWIFSFRFLTTVIWSFVVFCPVKVANCSFFLLILMFCLSPFSCRFHSFIFQFCCGRNDWFFCR